MGMTELVVVIALVGLMAGLGVPQLLRYYQTTALAAGADEFVGVLSRARALAITENTTVCVQVTGTNVQLRVPTCGDPVRTVRALTDTNGVIRLANSMQLSNAGASAVFTSTGGANPGATYTVRNPLDNHTRGVSVAATGRLTIQ
jgi:Tfp pilus assembly protein FimT